MPPTFAAATNTAWGRAAAIQVATAPESARSSASRGTVRISQSSRARRRTSALPTMPRWPAIQTRLPESS
jgi:hypothetical protein